MNKTQIIKALNSQVEGQSIKSITAVLTALTELITGLLQDNKSVNIQGLFSIENKLLKGRSGNLNNISYTVEDRLVPRIKLSPKLKKAVKNENR